MSKESKTRTMMISIDEAKIANIKDFPYYYAQKKHRDNLKDYLSEQFKANIAFEKDESINVIRANYRGFPLELIIFNGVILKIENEGSACLIEDFKPVFNSLFQAEPICTYNALSNPNGSYNPSIEWNLHPEERIFELVHGKNGIFKGYLTRFRDLYTRSVIESLGSNLLTAEGYKTLFGSELNSHPEFFKYKIKQILLAHPEFNPDNINEWARSTSMQYKKPNQE